MFPTIMATSKVSPKIDRRGQVGPPSNARTGVIIFAITLAILAYIDRVCISLVMPQIEKDLGFNNIQVGQIFAAFGLAYAAFEVPGGWMGDWMGPRKVLMRIVIWWSAFTALTGLMWNFLSMWFTRFLFGAGEAGCFPNLTKAFSVWLPQSERVRAQGIMWTFARWGGAFTPPLVLFVLAYVSWRGAFVIFGGLGLIWALWFYKWFRDNPKDHPGVNAGELKLLEGLEKNAESHGDVSPSTLRKAGLAVLLVLGTLGGTLLMFPKEYPYIFVGLVLIGGTAGYTWGRSHRGTIWGEMLCNRSVWLLWVQYFLLSFPWYFYITFLPKYLTEQRAFSPMLKGIGASFGWFQADANTASLAIFPLFFGGCGSLVCGLISARVARLTGSVKNTRRLMASLGFLGAGTMLLISIQIQDPLPAMLAMGFASFFNDLVMPGAWAACMDVGGRFAGTLAGSMNMMGNVAGFVAPMIGGRMVDASKAASGTNTADYHPFMYVMAVVYLLGTVVWPFIDPVKPIETSAAH
jgi:ACS family glucarate transporter-like MFS transporter